MVSAMTEERPGQTPAKRERPGSGVPVSPEKLTWMRNNRKLTREQLSDRITQVALDQNILDNHGQPVTYSRDAVAKLENGERKPKMYTFEALCAALECEASDLQEDFPGTGRAPMPAGMPSAEEVAQVLGDSTVPVESIMDQQMSTRTQNSIVRSGCTTVGELARASADGTLKDTQNLGFVQLTEIRKALAVMAADQVAADESSGETDVAKAS
jgi:transcriptional regulator with XRE-family HTH domain